MAKRQQFQCWNCEESFGLTRTFTGHPKLIAECPYCGAECVVDLAPFRTGVEVLMQGDANPNDATLETLDLPDVLPTRERTEADTTTDEDRS